MEPVISKVTKCFNEAESFTLETANSFLVLDTLCWQRFQSLCHHLVAFIKSQTAGMLGGEEKWKIGRKRVF